MVVVRRKNEEAKRRSAPRISGQVRFSSGRLEGTGYIHTISLSGARIATSAVVPQSGTVVSLFFCIVEEGEMLEVTGEVVEQFPDGFSARFTRLDTPIQDLLFAAAQFAAGVSEKDESS